MHILRHVLPSALLLASLPAQWVPRAPLATPGNRAGHCLAADLAGNVVLFGGTASFSPLNQTWRYDGTTWTQLMPTASPTGRTSATMVFDSVRGLFVLYGGWTSALSIGNANGQTWEFDGANWTQAAPVASPGGLWKHAMAFDAGRNRVVVYGGASNGFPIALADTWEYDGATWVQVPGASAPGPRESAAMCYHAALSRTVLFGGIDPQTGGNDSTWLFDGTTWTAAPAPGLRPAPRAGARMVYDSVRGVCVLTGGVDAMTGTPFSDTWEFDGFVWTQAPTTTTPGSNFGLAYDAARRFVVRYGGIAGSTPNGDTVEYGARNGTYGAGCAGSNGTPLLAASDAPRLGQNWQLALVNTSLVAPIAVIVLSQTQLAPTPLDGIGMTGCFAHVSPDLLATVPSSGGIAGWNGLIPAQIGLMGIGLYAQGLSLDPGVNAAGLVASNAVESLVGF